MNQPRKVVEEMTQFPYRAIPAMSATEARDLMRKADIRHLPVLDGDRLVGIISERDLRLAEGFEDRASLSVADVMHPDVYQVSLGTPLVEITRTMIARRVGSVVVLNSRGRVAGIFTTTDALELLTRLLEEHGEPESLFLTPDRFRHGRAASA